MMSLPSIEQEVLCAAFPYTGINNNAGESNYTKKSNAERINNILNGYHWHNHVLSLTASLIQAGCNDDAILALAPGLTLPGYTPEETIREMQAMIDSGRKKWNKPNPKTHSKIELNSRSLGQYCNDNSTPPEDIIGPRVVTEGGCTLFSGQPKTGKTNFAMNFAVRMAAGSPFLVFHPREPLKIYYLQAEMPHPYMQERIKEMSLGRQSLQLAEKNLIFSDRVTQSLTDENIAEIAGQILVAFSENALPDIIVIDPLANFFHSNRHNASESDNDVMLEVLRRLDCLRNMVNPKASLFIIHHVGKMGKFSNIDDNPHDAFRGASSLRGYYSTGIVLTKPDIGSDERNLYIERRFANDRCELPKMTLIARNQQWEVSPVTASILSGANQKNVRQRRDKTDTIVGLLRDEASKGRIYTNNSFAEKFQDTNGLGSSSSIREHISALMTKGAIKSHKPAAGSGIPSTNSKWGYLCVEEMKYNGQLFRATHHKCSSTGELQLLNTIC